MEAYAITVNVPLELCDSIRDAMGNAGAGLINGYEYCSFSYRGMGRSKPSESTHPYIGKHDELTPIEEEKIETFCELEKLPAIIEAIKNAHPYEEPAITYWKVTIA